MDEGCDGAKGVEMGLGRKVSHHYELVKELLGVDMGKRSATGKQNSPCEGLEGVKSVLKPKKRGQTKGGGLKDKVKSKSRKLPTTPRSRVRSAIR